MRITINAGVRDLYVAIIATLAVAALPAWSAPAGTAALEAELARIATSIDGVVGVAAWRLDGKGPRVGINDSKSFPMASTFKVAVAGALMHKVDENELSLKSMLTIEPSMHVPSPVIAQYLKHPGVSLSMHNLLELMLTQSDNTATDVLTAAAGGPQAVTAWVRDQGVDNLRVDRDTAGLLRDFFELPPGPFAEALAVAMKADPNLQQKGMHPNPAFFNDPRDTSTPAAMAELLTRIFNGEALSPDSTETLIATMRRCQTGQNRLPGRLPQGTVVAHKTGTIGGSLNDVGVLTLPNDAGRFAIAVFIKESNSDWDARERVIADIGRAVYDFYLFSQDAATIAAVRTVPPFSPRKNDAP